MKQQFIDRLIESISDKVAEKIAAYLIDKEIVKNPSGPSRIPDNVVVMYGCIVSPYSGDIVNPFDGNGGTITVGQSGTNPMVGEATETIGKSNT